MLSCSGFGDESLLAHALGKQCLTQHVVDLVRTRMVQILALEDQPDSESPSEVVTLREDRRATRILTLQTTQLGAKIRIVPASLKARSSSWQAGTRVSGTN